jgi:hypothetical protein
MNDFSLNLLTKINTLMISGMIVMKMNSLILFLILIIPVRFTWSQNSLSEDFRQNAISQKETLYIKRVLILGDSHLLGTFGEALHRNLHETGEYDVLSIAIGGAGTRNFISTLRNNCCGFAIRESFHDENISPDKRIRRVEADNTLTGELIGKKYHGKIENVLQAFDPHLTVIALGRNNINAHQQLVNILRLYNVQMVIIWVSPYRNMFIHRQLHDIENVVMKNGLFHIRSDDILGTDTTGSAHFYGKKGENWARKIFERIQPVIVQAIPTPIDFQHIRTNHHPDTFHVLLQFADDIRFFQNEQNLSPHEILLPSLQFEEETFIPRYLQRFFMACEAPADTGRMSDADGNTYKTFSAGNKVWMAEDLRTTTYRDGSKIQQLSANTPYYHRKKPAYLIRHSQGSSRSEKSYLYTWDALKDSRGLCPKGWHVPDMYELYSLFTHADIPADFFTSSTIRVISDGRVIQNNLISLFWTISPVDDHTSSAWAWLYQTENQTFSFINLHQKTALPVRCVKD